MNRPTDKHTYKKLTQRKAPASLAKGVAIGLAVAASLGFSAFASAGDRHRPGGHQGYTDYARVTHVQPVYRKVAHQRPTRECHSNGRAQHGHHNNRPHLPRPEAVVGGLIGGAIGHQIGRHSGDRHATVGATVFGAIVGSALGNEGGHRHSSGNRHSGNRNKDRQGHGHGNGHKRPGKTCTTTTQIYYESELSYYIVNYVWRGHRDSVKTKIHPGKVIKIDTREYTNYQPNIHRPNRPGSGPSHAYSQNYNNAQNHVHGHNHGHNHGHSVHKPHRRPHRRPHRKNRHSRVDNRR